MGGRQWLVERSRWIRASKQCEEEGDSLWLELGWLFFLLSFYAFLTLTGLNQTDIGCYSSRRKSRETSPCRFVYRCLQWYSFQPQGTGEITKRDCSEASAGLPSWCTGLNFFWPTQGYKGRASLLPLKLLLTCKGSIKLTSPYPCQILGIRNVKKSKFMLLPYQEWGFLWFS